MNELVLVSAAIFSAQVVKGVTGFGSALVAVPLLALLWPDPGGTPQAIFVAVACDLMGGVVLLWEVRRLVRGVLLLAMVPAGVLGQHLGTEVLVALPPEMCRAALAFTVGAFALGLIIRPVRAGRGDREDLPSSGRRAFFAQATAAGFASGAMAGLVGAGGPPVVLFMKHHFKPMFFRAQLIAFFVCGAISLLGMLVVKDAVGEQDPLFLLFLVLPLLLGNRLGASIAPRLSPTIFGRSVGIILFATASVMLLG